MRKTQIILLAMICIMSVSGASAMQEVNDATIVDYTINYDQKKCTIIIDQDHPVTESTRQCKRKAFSWKCLNDDYLWHMVQHLNKNHLPIDIRYADSKCFDGEGSNMQLLTVW